MWEISERLKNEVREDVIWKKEAEVEAKVISMLQEIKDQVMLEDEYVHDLYRKEFKAKLKEKEHTWIWDTFKKLNNIKLWIIERELNKRKGEILEPNRVTKNVIYPVCGISMDINKNWKVSNVIKGECMDSISFILRYISSLLTFVLLWSKQFCIFSPILFSMI